MTVSRRAVLQAALAAGAPLSVVQSISAASVPSEKPPISTAVLAKGNGRQAYAGILANLAGYMASHLKEYGLPGMTCSVADRDGFAASIDVGWCNVERREPLQSEHLFQIGSISKSFASICILHAAATGRLKLDEPLANLVPGLPLPAETITVRQLLCHTSGLPDDAPPFPRGGKQRLWTGFPPGSHFSYSNTGYALLGSILERIYRQPYDEIVQTVILTPLGMSHTKGAIRIADQSLYAQGYWPYYLNQPLPQRGRLGAAYFTEFTRPSGCIASTASDMSRYVNFLIRAGAGQGAPLLSDADARQFTTAVVDAPDFGPNAKYALGLAVVPVGDVSCLHHTGGMTSFSSSIHIDHENGVGAFASTNCAIGGYRPRGVSYFACQLMRAMRAGFAAPSAPAIKQADQIANAGVYAGDYASAEGETLSFRANGGQLLASIKGESVAAQLQDEDVLLIPHHRFERLLLSFQRESGKPVAAWWGETCFTRQPAAAASSGAVSSALQGLAGYYTNNDPWAGTIVVVARGEELWVDGTKKLVPLSEGIYRVGEDPLGCERISFDAPFDGKPQRLQFSGVDYQRDTSDIGGIFGRKS